MAISRKDISTSAYGAEMTNTSTSPIMQPKNVTDSETNPMSPLTKEIKFDLSDNNEPKQSKPVMEQIDEEITSESVQDLENQVNDLKKTIEKQELNIE